MTHDSRHDPGLEADNDLDIDVDVSFEHDEAVICCRILASLMLADDDFSDTERAFLDNTMTGMGLDELERQAALQPMSEDDILIAAKRLSPTIRKPLLDALFQVALVDGHMDNNEMRYISEVRRILSSS